MVTSFGILVVQLAYAQVFCNALAAILWSTTGVPQIVFGVMVVPLSCMELEEQVGLQSIMASVRFVAIFIIAFGSLTALFLDDSKTSRDKPPYFAHADPLDCELMSYTSCISGFSVAFSTFVFAQLFQHSVPGLLRPLRDQPTRIKRVPLVLGGSLVTTYCLYGMHLRGYYLFIYLFIYCVAWCIALNSPHCVSFLCMNK
jgi:hypothetical protein